VQRDQVLVVVGPRHLRAELGLRRVLDVQPCAEPFMSFERLPCRRNGGREVHARDEQHDGELHVAHGRVAEQLVDRPVTDAAPSKNLHSAMKMFSSPERMRMSV